MIRVLGSHEDELPPDFQAFVRGPLMDSLTGLEDNFPLAVALGGSHSKWLQNSRSDVDLILFYTTTARNLLSFNRKTLSINPSGFRQIGSDPVLYEWKDHKFELDVVPVRRVGEGNDLFGNLRKCNMKTIHDLLKDYQLLPVSGQWADLLYAVERELDFSIEAIVGYFSGYMTSQLMSHRRRTDFEKRELKAWREHDPNPVVKAIMNGMYIGLSGLYLLDVQSISRDFAKLWNRYRCIFDSDQANFVEKCYQHKTDRELLTGSIEHFLEEAAVLRDRIFATMQKQFQYSKVDALESKRFSVEPDQKENGEILDALQFRMLGVSR